MTIEEGRPVASISRTLPGPAEYMCGLTWDGTHLWHSDQDAKKIYSIDPSDGAVLRAFDCALVRADLAHDGTRIGQIGGRPKRIVLIDQTTGDTVGSKQVLPASGRLTGTEYGPEGLWMCLRGPTVVQLRNRESMDVLREYPVWGSSPSGLTCADGIIVYGDFDDAVLHALDPDTGTHLGSAWVPGRPTGLTWDGERLWYCDFPARSFRAIELDQVVHRAQS